MIFRLELIRFVSANKKRCSKNTNDLVRFKNTKVNRNKTIMKDLIKQTITGKNVLLLFILTNIVYVMMLTITIPELMRFSGGVKILDMMPAGYNTKYVKTLFEALGEKGREAYLFHQLPVDLIYPFLFGISSSLMLAYFLNKLGKMGGNLLYLCLIPLFSGLFDYGENIGIIILLKTYPNNSILLIQITNVFSILKSSFTTIYFIVLIVLLIAFGKNQIFPKKK